jgi:argininosuccinate lyase
MVSYTHVQHAQPVSVLLQSTVVSFRSQVQVAFWLSHYASAFLRDLDRLKRAYDVTDQNPLGAGAIAGTASALASTEGSLSPQALLSPSIAASPHS